MPALKLTAAAVSRLPTPASGRAEHRDAEVIGYFVRVYSDGRKVACIRYRTTTGERRLTIGPIGATMTAHQAREEARRRLAEVRQGGDPSGDKRAQRAALRVVELVDRYRADRIPGMKPSTQISEEHLLVKHVLPRLGSRTVDSLTRRDVERIKADMRSTPGAANKVIGLISRLCTFAEEEGHRPPLSNPCRGVERNKGRTIERFMTADERARLERALAAAEQATEKTRGHVDAAACACFRLLALTGMRLGEAVALRWDDVDLDHRRLVLPTSKTGAKIVRLSTAAAEVIDALPRSGDRVFTAADGQPLSNMQRRWIAIRNAADLRDLRIHDLRHAWASDAAMNGVPLAMIGRHLGHASLSTTQRYSHLADDVIAQAVERVGEVIAANTARGDSSPKIVAMRKGGL